MAVSIACARCCFPWDFRVAGCEFFAKSLDTFAYLHDTKRGTILVENILCKVLFFIAELATAYKISSQYDIIEDRFSRSLTFIDNLPFSRYSLGEGPVEAVLTHQIYFCRKGVFNIREEGTHIKE